jgi:hypothetical protein
VLFCAIFIIFENSLNRLFTIFFKSSTPTTVYLFLLRNLWEVTMPLSTFQPLRGTLPGVRKFGEANGKYKLNVYGKV